MPSKRKAGPSGLSPEFIRFVATAEGGEEHRDGQGRWVPYQDPAGLWTIGRGHLIGDGSDPGEFAKGLSDEEVAELFKKDLMKAREQARQKVGAGLFDGLGLDEQEMLTDFSFNVGPEFPKKFPKFTGAVLKGDRAGALAESDRSFTNPKGERQLLDQRNQSFRELFAEEVK